MHLKNFSLFKDPKLGYNLSLAYDMVAAALVVEGDDEELALNLNGRKKKLRRKDFEVSAELFKMDKKVLDKKRMRKALPKWHMFIDISFLPEKMKLDYHAMLDRRPEQLKLM